MAVSEREPAVAGRFYPADPRRLEQEVARYLAGSQAAPEQAKPRRVIAVIAPHAGYVFSGAIAGETYARVEVPERAVVLNPNHTGMGSPRSIWSAGVWRLPGGSVPVDEPLAAHIRQEAKLEDDRRAHLHEHSGEVQLPFLRARRPEVRVVPICLSNLSLKACHSLGEGLARAVQQAAGDARDILLVASTDMSHFVSAEEARRLDMMALERVEKLDPDGLYEVVTENDISMCGFIPTTVVLVAARSLGANHVDLVRYGNSGETSGDYARVVGYVGAIVS